MTGTPKYASIAAHKGVEQTRRDDLESACYAMVYLMRGNLPWEGVLSDNPEEKYEIIGKIKEKKTPEFICKGLPGILVKYKTIAEMERMLSYCRNLRFDEDPNYDLLYGLIFSALKQKKYSFEFRFPWIEKYATNVADFSTIPHHNEGQR